MGVSVPNEVSVIGYDNMEFSKYLNLTTVSQPIDIISEISSKILVEEMETKKNRMLNIVVEPEVIIRKTTAPPRKG